MNAAGKGEGGGDGGGGGNASPRKSVFVADRAVADLHLFENGVVGSEKVHSSSRLFSPRTTSCS